MSGDIEFLSPDVGMDDPGVPEFESRPARPSWLTWAARCAVIALAVGVLAVWVATRPSGTGPRTVAVAPSPSASAPSLRRVEGGAGITMCGAEVSDLAGLSAAMRKMLPGIVLDGGSSLTCGDGAGATDRVVFVSAGGTLRDLDIEVDLTARRAATARTDSLAPSDTRDGKALIGSVQAESAGLVVNVNAYSRSRKTAPMNRLLGLADYLSLNFVL